MMRVRPKLSAIPAADRPPHGGSRWADDDYGSTGSESPSSDAPGLSDSDAPFDNGSESDFVDEDIVLEDPMSHHIEPISEPGRDEALVTSEDIVASMVLPEVSAFVEETAMWRVIRATGAVAVPRSVARVMAKYLSLPEEERPGPEVFFEESIIRDLKKVVMSEPVAPAARPSPLLDSDTRSFVDRAKAALTRIAQHAPIALMPDGQPAFLAGKSVIIAPQPVPHTSNPRASPDDAHFKHLAAVAEGETSVYGGMRGGNTQNPRLLDDLLRAMGFSKLSFVQRGSVVSSRDYEASNECLLMAVARATKAMRPSQGNSALKLVFDSEETMQPPTIPVAICGLTAFREAVAYLYTHATVVQAAAAFLDKLFIYSSSASKKNFDDVMFFVLDLHRSVSLNAVAMRHLNWSSTLAQKMTYLVGTDGPPFFWYPKTDGAGAEAEEEVQAKLWSKAQKLASDLSSLEDVVALMVTLLAWRASFVKNEQMGVKPKFGWLSWFKSGGTGEDESSNAPTEYKSITMARSFDEPGLYNNLMDTAGFTKDVHDACVAALRSAAAGDAKFNYQAMQAAGARAVLGGGSDVSWKSPIGQRLQKLIRDGFITRVQSCRQRIIAQDGLWNLGIAAAAPVLGKADVALALAALAMRDNVHGWNKDDAAADATITLPTVDARILKLHKHDNYVAQKAIGGISAEMGERSTEANAWAQTARILKVALSGPNGPSTQRCILEAALNAAQAALRSIEKGTGDMISIESRLRENKTTVERVKKWVWGKTKIAELQREGIVKSVDVKSLLAALSWTCEYLAQCMEDEDDEDSELVNLNNLSMSASVAPLGKRGIFESAHMNASDAWNAKHRDGILCRLERDLGVPALGDYLLACLRAGVTACKLYADDASKASFGYIDYNACMYDLDVNNATLKRDADEVVIACTKRQHVGIVFVDNAGADPITDGRDNLQTQLISKFAGIVKARKSASRDELGSWWHSALNFLHTAVQERMVGRMWTSTSDSGGAVTTEGVDILETETNFLYTATNTDGISKLEAYARSLVIYNSPVIPSNLKFLTGWTGPVMEEVLTGRNLDRTPDDVESNKTAIEMASKAVIAPFPQIHKDSLIFDALCRLAKNRATLLAQLGNISDDAVADVE